MRATYYATNLKDPLTWGCFFCLAANTSIIALGAWIQGDLWWRIQENRIPQDLFIANLYLWLISQISLLDYNVFWATIRGHLGTRNPSNYAGGVRWLLHFTAGVGFPDSRIQGHLRYGLQGNWSLNNWSEGSITATIFLICFPWDPFTLYLSSRSPCVQTFETMLLEALSKPPPKKNIRIESSHPHSTIMCQPYLRVGAAKDRVEGLSWAYHLCVYGLLVIPQLSSDSTCVDKQSPFFFQSISVPWI